jgi:branched-chain amino acid transport system substrate-binding protein
VIFIEKVNVKSELPSYQAFRDTYRKRFQQDPDFAAVLSYDAFRVVWEALKRDPAGKDLKRAILGIRKFAGLQGPFEIDANGDAARRHYIMTVRDNDFALVE